ncbi:outer membrane protein [Brevundimonas sp.]|uniref:outer membrane protein n=1 Tax=Brevundimonas sp. TaxID=1871086 RepID=UPI002D2CBCF8|nr:outer membrane protein [Brevundimonas sp.]HYD28750.1 outer membrane protein [Brevundimonas sp.]
MKKILLATVLVLGVGAAGAASAQDWTGPHIGANIGLAGDKFTYPLEADVPPLTIDGEASLTSSGFVGGAQIGYDWQFSNRWVFGLEGDLNVSDLKGRLAVDGAAAGGISGALEAQVGSEVEYFGTARARLGYAYGDKLLPYVTAGVAFGDVNSEYDATLTSGGSTVFTAAGDVSSSQTGWTAGAGVEYRFAENLTLKSEYLYVDLGDYNIITASGGGASASLDAETTFNVVRVGLNYRF